MYCFFTDFFQLLTNNNTNKIYRNHRVSEWLSGGNADGMFSLLKTKNMQINGFIFVVPGRYRFTK